jgi:hypothetical protein
MSRSRGKRPERRTDEHLLNQLHAAEIRVQEGDWQGPYLTLMSLAQQTRDPRLAKRAAEMALAAKQADDTLAAVRLWRQLDAELRRGESVLSGAGHPVRQYLGRSRNILKAPGRRRRPARAAWCMFQVQQLLRAPRTRKRARHARAPGRALPNMLEGPRGAGAGALARGDKEDARARRAPPWQIKPDSEIAVLTLAQVSEDEAQVRRRC